MVKISYAVTVWDEVEEVKELLTRLTDFMRHSDEIVIQQDTSHTQTDTSKEVSEYIDILSELHGNIRCASYPLNADFAAFKNNLNEQCKGDYIFQLDADEMPSIQLIEELPTILEGNSIELIQVPRENLVEGLTEAHIEQWHWRVDSEGRVNYPDFQGRIYKNDPDRIKWVGNVHEIIQYAETAAAFPLNEGYDILHHKTILKQEQQNQLYETM